MFFVFRDFYVLCIYIMNIICTFHMSVSWVWYIRTDIFSLILHVVPSPMYELYKTIQSLPLLETSLLCVSISNRIICVR